MLKTKKPAKAGGVDQEGAGSRPKGERATVDGDPERTVRETRRKETRIRQPGGRGRQRLAKAGPGTRRSLPERAQKAGR